MGSQAKQVRVLTKRTGPRYRQNLRCAEGPTAGSSKPAQAETHDEEKNFGNCGRHAGAAACGGPSRSTSTSGNFARTAARPGLGRTGPHGGIGPAARGNRRRIAAPPTGPKRFQIQDAGPPGRLRSAPEGREYSLKPSMTPRDILALMEKGTVRLHRLTIPEGLTLAQIAEQIEKSGSPGRQTSSCGLWTPPMPGHRESTPRHWKVICFPKPIFSPGRSPRTESSPPCCRRSAPLSPGVGAACHGARLRRARGGDPGLHHRKGNRRSIERPLIASVFHNRLKRGMRLETDPTVIYAIKDFDGNLTRKHLETPTPFNTYIIRGLPPGPIANPGKEALKAALFPAQSDYIFFVSKNNGTTNFQPIWPTTTAPSSSISSVRAGLIPAAARPTKQQKAPLSCPRLTEAGGDYSFSHFGQQAGALPMTPSRQSVGVAAMKDPQRRKHTLLIDLEKLNTLNAEGCPACGQKLL